MARVSINAQNYPLAECSTRLAVLSLPTLTTVVGKLFQDLISSLETLLVLLHLIVLLK